MLLYISVLWLWTGLTVIWLFVCCSVFCLSYACLFICVLGLCAGVLQRPLTMDQSDYHFIWFLGFLSLNYVCLFACFLFWFVCRCTSAPCDCGPVWPSADTSSNSVSCHPTTILLCLRVKRDPTFKTTTYYNQCQLIQWLWRNKLNWQGWRVHNPHTPDGLPPDNNLTSDQSEVEMSDQREVEEISSSMMLATVCSWEASSK